MECSVCPGPSTPESQEGEGEKNGGDGFRPRAEWAALAPWAICSFPLGNDLGYVSFAIFPGELFVLLYDL